jgi:hypothetical protein
MDLQRLDRDLRPVRLSESVARHARHDGFIGKLGALVPRPRTNLVRHHGRLAPHASIRACVVRDGRGPWNHRQRALARDGALRYWGDLDTRRARARGFAPRPIAKTLGEAWAATAEPRPAAEHRAP